MLKSHLDHPASKDSMVVYYPKSLLTKHFSLPHSTQKVRPVSFNHRPFFILPNSSVFSLSRANVNFTDFNFGNARIKRL